MEGVSYFYSMRTFLEETLESIRDQYSDLSKLTLILPSKRAGGFLKNYLRNSTSKTSFAPKIISIEEFIEELSDLKIIETTELLFKSYDVYLNTQEIKEKEEFETFASWATTLLNDFNEIDRYLIDPKTFFNYLASIKTLERWGVKDEKTQLVENYLNFWEGLFPFYENLKNALIAQHLGYQGMVYREASEAIVHYINSHGDKSHIFIGFNALNNAEQHIFQEILETGNSDIYWDADDYLHRDKEHAASLFLQDYISNWKFFTQNPPKIISNNFQKTKNIQFVAAQKNIAQAKYVGELLATYSEEKLNKTAIVLADEALLQPILHSLPKNVSTVNITMGVALKTFPATVFFEIFLALHINSTKTIYYKDVVSLLNHPLLSPIIPNASKITANITAKNITHLDLTMLYELSEERDHQLLALLFSDKQNKSVAVIDSSIQLLEKLKVQKNMNQVEHIILFQLFSVFKKLKALNEKFSHLKTVKTVQGLFSELITTTTLDFQGDAYNGLQIMGVLETRVLDFETVIMTSVNEGILPSGKSNASFITYDLKHQFNLPKYTEKDAIYTYHFYHLLHRATDITLLYNNHSEGLNAGEKSRFLLQLELENNPNHHLENVILSPKIKIENQSLKTVYKNELVLQRLEEIAEKGFSPSALTSYIRNPMDFYYQKVLKINEFQEVEETVAANTLGTIVHDTLEAFYKPLEGQYLSLGVLQEMKAQIESQVTEQFVKTFKGGTFSHGKNLIIYEVAKRYISNFIDFEISEIVAGNRIQILQIERKLYVTIPMEELNFPVKIGGTVDRVDEYNGTLRIIDYKTGKVEQKDVEIVDWDEITADYKYSKAFQILAYATMINKDLPIDQAEAGIISFKNLNQGFLKFGTKEKSGSKNKVQIVTPNILKTYSSELKKLILEICDPTIPFTEKEIDQ
tara:strand:+ start:149298 stop:152057 length:2760 start_codon:yes stop_codon:yes gene_type:complete